MLPNANAESGSFTFLLPDLGEGLEEAELIEWCVEVGQRVQENDILCKMETAKALVDVPSPRAGIISSLHGKPGQAIKVGAALVTFKAAEADAGSVVGDLGAPAGGAGEGKVAATPAVRRLAREMGVDLEQVHGSGIAGRITAHDVELAAGRGSAHAGNGGAGNAPPAETRAPALPGDAERIPFRGIRRTIAEHLRYSVNHAVHFTVMDEADVTALEELRRKLVAASNEKISILPFVAFAVCRVLSGELGRDFARLNATVDDEQGEIVQHRAVHLGIATDTDSGLMVPVICNAQRLGVLELSRRIAELAKAARDRTLRPDQLTGSTFTLSNFGSMGGRFGTPIINYPEAGILAIGRVREGVVVRDGMMGVGRLLPLSMSADHRVVDGATAATMLVKIVEMLQSPEELMPARRQEDR